MSEQPLHDMVAPAAPQSAALAAPIPMQWPSGGSPPTASWMSVAAPLAAGAPPPEAALPPPPIDSPPLRAVEAGVSALLPPQLNKSRVATTQRWRCLVARDRAGA